MLTFTLKAVFNKTMLLILLSCCYGKSFAIETTVADSSVADKQALRIVALAPHIVEMLYGIGAGGQIIGTVNYADHPEAAKKIPRIGGYYGIQIEKILALNPDIVIAWQSGNKQSDIEQITRLGIPLVLSKPDKVDDVAKELRLFGELTGRQAQAEIVALAYEKRLAALKYENKDKTPIKLFYQLWSEPMMTVNKSTWINQLIDICQGINVFADNPTDYPQISIENVIVAQPELMVIPDEKSDKPQPKINWEKWPEIPAVKHNRFIHVNADLMHRFGTRMLDGIEGMCAKIDLHR